jgi:hypothetical protein
MSGTSKWQLRLMKAHDGKVSRLAKLGGVSKNDVVRCAVLLIDRLQSEIERGGRVLIERKNGGRKTVELWVLW